MHFSEKYVNLRPWSKPGYAAIAMMVWHCDQPCAPIPAIWRPVGIPTRRGRRRAGTQRDNPSTPPTNPPANQPPRGTTRRPRRRAGTQRPNPPTRSTSRDANQPLSDPTRRLRRRIHPHMAAAEIRNGRGGRHQPPPTAVHARRISPRSPRCVRSAPRGFRRRSTHRESPLRRSSPPRPPPRSARASA